MAFFKKYFKKWNIGIQKSTENRFLNTIKTEHFALFALDLIFLIEI